MTCLEWFKQFFYIDYGKLGKEDKQLIYEEFVEECISRINVITVIMVLGELIIAFSDFMSGFFNEHPLNILNLIGAIIVITASLITNYTCNKLIQKEASNCKEKTILLYAYKLTLLVAVCLFITTDVLVRQKTIGAYIVFLFIFQILPFFDEIKNVGLYIFLAIYISAIYLLGVPCSSVGTLFSIVAILYAFAFSTECLRGYSIKKLISSRMNELMTGRFSRLAKQTILTLSNTVEAKDLYTQGHSQRVASYSREIGRRLGYNKHYLDEIYYIGLLHDIGKLGIPDEVINKKGRLTDEEFAEIKKHPDMGYHILKNITEIPDISIGARYHHEKVNGTGYPEGLMGDEIPKIAQIIAVADAYDAMTSNRSYREVMPQEKVRNEIEKNSGTQFAPDIAKIMLQMIDDDINYTMHG